MRASQPGYRRVLGKTFHLLASIWVVGPVKDTQCGFKGFRRDVAQRRVRPPEGHEHRVRRRAHLPRPPARLPHRRRARSGGPTSAAPGCTRAFGLAIRVALGPVPHPADPSDVGAPRAARPTGRPPERGRSDAAGRGARAGCCRSSPSPSFALTVGATLAVAGDTLGYDFRAYHAAASRVLEGRPLYDTFGRRAASGCSTTRRRSCRSCCRSGCCRRSPRPGRGPSRC